MGEHVIERLNAEFMPLPWVGNIEGKGCFVGVELVRDKNTKALPDAATKVELHRKLLENGLWLRVVGMPGCRLAICPPCIITIEEADKILDMLYPLVAKLKL